MSDGNVSVLITGANGFVGSRLVRRMLGQGLRVVAGVRKTADCSLLDGLEIEYRYGDVTRPDSLPDMVRGVDYIVHNAGVVKARKRDRYFAVNERGTRNLFEAVAEHNPAVKRIIYISSVAVAGPSEPGCPVRESEPRNPITTYGRSKAAGEKVALSFADRLNVVVVRPPAVYGPGDREMFTVFKTVYRRLKPYVGNRDRRIQFVHVDDLSLGIATALLSEAPSGAVYFIAEKQSYTLDEMIDIMHEATGRRALPLVVPSGLFRCIAAVSEFAFRMVGATPMLTREKTRELDASWEVDVAHARDEIGFESKISFRDGVRQTYDWYLARGWL